MCQLQPLQGSTKCTKNLSLLAKIQLEIKLFFFSYFWATRVISDNVCDIFIVLEIVAEKHPASKQRQTHGSYVQHQV